MKTYTQAQIDLAIAAERDAITKRYRSMLFRLMRVEYSLNAECEWTENINEAEGQFTPAERHEIERIREEAWMDWMHDGKESGYGPEADAELALWRAAMRRGEIII